MASRVAVQQQRRLFREGLRDVLRAEEDLDVCGSTTTGEELVRLCADERPDVVLLEADASGWDVARLCAGLRRANPGLRLVGLRAAPSTPSDLYAAKRAGMCALVSQDMGIEGILTALRAAVSTASRGNLAVLRAPAVSKLHARPLLTPRELNVLHLVGAGCTSREISRRLGISHKTVENHKQRVFGKLGVQNQAHAVSVAMRTGILRAGDVLDLAMAD